MTVDPIVLHGDCLDIMRHWADDTVDAVVTDPPYGLGFMGSQWDQPGHAGASKKRRPESARGHKNLDGRPTNNAAVEAGRYDFTANQGFGTWCTEWAIECLRVLKPGGHILAFGGTRTWHRLAVAIEDAGFEMRDSLAWLYGSGFPKSLDVSKALDKAAGAERAVIGSKIYGGGHVQNSVESMGYGGNEQGADVRSITAPTTDAAKQWAGWGTALKPAFEPIVMGRKPFKGTVAANVLAHGTGALNIDACRIPGEHIRTTRNTALGVMNDDGWQPRSAVFESHKDGRWPANVVLDDAMAEVLDEQSGTLTSGANPAIRGGDTDKREVYGGFSGGRNEQPRRGTDSGGASRFFYVAKAPAKERPKVDGIAHPTVKPLTLMRWLVRLVTPPGGLVLDPFAGSGTTLQAAQLEGFNAIGIERELTYLPLIKARLSLEQSA